jgi:hypothetical protein
VHRSRAPAEGDGHPADRRRARFERLHDQTSHRILGHALRRVASPEDAAALGRLSHDDRELLTPPPGSRARAVRQAGFRGTRTPRCSLASFGRGNSSALHELGGLPVLALLEVGGGAQRHAAPGRRGRRPATFGGPLPGHQLGGHGVAKVVQPAVDADAVGELAEAPDVYLVLAASHAHLVTLERAAPTCHGLAADPPCRGGAC